MSGLTNPNKAAAVNLRTAFHRPMTHTDFNKVTPGGPYDTSTVIN